MPDTVVPVQEIPADTEFDAFAEVGLNLVSEGLPYLFVTVDMLSEEDLKDQPEGTHGLRLTMRVGNGLPVEFLPRLFANALESVGGYSE